MIAPRRFIILTIVTAPVTSRMAAEGKRIGEPSIVNLDNVTHITPITGHADGAVVHFCAAYPDGGQPYVIVRESINEIADKMDPARVELPA